MLKVIEINGTKISEKELLSRNIKGSFNKLKKAKVCILGLGGLGSNVAVLLARAGIGKLKLIDFDKVELSNLNRQQYRISHMGMNKTEALTQIIKEVNPFVEIETLNIEVTEKNIHSIIKDFQIIIEAFDNAKSKAMLVQEILSSNSNKIVISASGMAGLGSSNEIKTKKIRKDLYLIGDTYSDYEEFSGIMSSRVMICASHQANIVLKLILEQEEKEENKINE